MRFDLGCVYQGYRSDISRTAVLGSRATSSAATTTRLRDGEIAAIAAMKPGVPVSQIFETAMRVTREHGMPHYERHHVGHGIGLEPYDPPTINAATHTALEPGMVFCVETPYYEHGWGGVQVEDAVEITAGGSAGSPGRARSSRSSARGDRRAESETPFWTIVHAAASSARAAGGAPRRAAHPVGFSSAMTGPSAITGEGVKWGATLADEESTPRAASWAARSRRTSPTTRRTPGEAVSAVRKLADVDKVDVIIGQTHSGACLGAMPVVKELGCRW